ncbi:hypothetical protein [Burkholderia territorii]|uniref:hypothetical protein n=1 Tax=Burkholderia territorii TaxID=1503055 RepID=UPI0012D88074|nr:hypothetical protein [Burkholderia territorii]
MLSEDADAHRQALATKARIEVGRSRRSPHKKTGRPFGRPAFFEIRSRAFA